MTGFDEDAMKAFFGDVPGRPNHPDFWRMSECLMRNDSIAEESPRNQAARVAAGRDPKKEKSPMDDIVDFASINYTMEQRIARFFDFIRMGLIPKDPPQESLKAMYLDAFMLGYRYHEAGGHRER